MKIAMFYLLLALVVWQLLTVAKPRSKDEPAPAIYATGNSDILPLQNHLGW